VPLRDHFRPPVDKIVSWEEIHAQWPAVIVQNLRKRLPPGYSAGPRVYLGSHGSQVEIDVAAFEKDRGASWLAEVGDGGVAVAAWAPPIPDLEVETTLPEFDEYEVRVYDARRGRRLVAAIEIVSPANKDRPEHRNMFVAKCTALLQKGVAVSIVDLVTVRQYNLYAEMLAFIGHDDQTTGDNSPSIYAATCRWIEKDKRTILQGWSKSLAAGHPLPTLPLWLSPELAIPLELEESYETAFSDLGIA
jgi:Protein of unknown function (DUF4058)